MCGVSPFPDAETKQRLREVKRVTQSHTVTGDGGGLKGSTVDCCHPVVGRRRALLAAAPGWGGVLLAELFKHQCGVSTGASLPG